MAKTEQSLKLKILALSVKDNEQSWTMKAKSLISFGSSKAEYNASIVVDAEHYETRKKKIENDIKKAKSTPDMFDDSKSEINALQEDLKLLEQERKEYEKMEIKNFHITTEMVDYFKDTFTFKISESTLLSIINIRENFDKFVIQLD